MTAAVEFSHAAMTAPERTLLAQKQTVQLKMGKRAPNQKVEIMGIKLKRRITPQMMTLVHYCTIKQKTFDAQISVSGYSTFASYIDTKVKVLLFLNNSGGY